MTEHDLMEQWLIATRWLVDELKDETMFSDETVKGLVRLIQKKLDNFNMYLAEMKEVEA